MTAESPQLSPLERIKSQSDYLRGGIAAELADAADHFSDASAQLLKLHGIHQQDDRDRRRHLGGPGGPPDARAYSFMIRTAIPGGRLRTDQLLAELDLCDEVGSGTLRITSRQSLQLYGVAKQNLVRTLRRLNEVGLTTLGACGDAARNVMCCPAPYCRDPVHGQIQWMAGHLAGELAAAARPPIAKSGWATAPAPHAADGGRGTGRAALRPQLPAAETQGGHRPARRQLRRSLRPGRGPDGACARIFKWPATTCWWAGAWA